MSGATLSPQDAPGPGAGPPDGSGEAPGQAPGEAPGAGGNQGAAPPTTARRERLRTTPGRDLPVWLCVLASVGVLAAALVLVFSRTMDRYLDHDEHQFVATAALWAREGLLPYVDFPHFHMPYFVFVYGLLGEWTGKLLLSARLVSVAGAWGTMLLLHATVLRASRGLLPAWRHGLACGAVLLLLFNPLYVYTSGLAWNHDLAVMLALAAFLVHLPGSGRAWLAGMLLGLAIGVRLSVAPLAASFLIVQQLREERGHRARMAVTFLSGLAVALLPCAVLLVLAPRAMLFGNLEYPALNTAYRVQEGFDRAMDLPAKLDYMAVDVFGEPANLTLFCVFLLGLSGLNLTRRSGVLRRVLWFLPFLLLGALAPTPAWYQYFYALVPFLILGGLCGLGALPQDSRRLYVGLGAVAVTVVISIWQTLPDYRTLSNLTDPSSWTPLQVHAEGRRVAEAAGDGLVLTLSPLYPLEGGARIDPAFGSGPFGYRSAPFLTPEERAEHGLVGPDELQAHLAASPPAAVLTGYEPRDDAGLDAWAADHGYVEQPVGERLRLHLPPGPR